jgi:predicted cobalt transporter CbtA
MAAPQWSGWFTAFLVVAAVGMAALFAGAVRRSDLLGVVLIVAELVTGVMACKRVLDA